VELQPRSPFVGGRSDRNTHDKPRMANSENAPLEKLQFLSSSRNLW
jgi:hypothetical protein